MRAAAKPSPKALHEDRLPIRREKRRQGPVAGGHRQARLRAVPAARVGSRATSSRTGSRPRPSSSRGRGTASLRRCPRRSRNRRPRRYSNEPWVATKASCRGPILAAGIDEAALAPTATLLGHAAGEAVLLVRRGGDVLAVGATCTHYGGPLAEGVVDGDTVRCPWHHACFDLRTGTAVRGPALNALRLLRRRARRRPHPRRRAQAGRARPRRPPAARRASIVIIGARRRRRLRGGDAAPRGLRGRPPRLRRRRGPARSTGPTSRRTTSPAPRPRSGCRCAPRPSSRSSASSSQLGARVAGARRRGPQAHARRRARGRVGRAAARDRRGARPPRGAGRRPAARPHAAHARRQPRHHRARQGRRSARSSSARASSASRRRRRCARAASRSTSSRPTP